MRRPVHVLYGGAHLFQAGTASKLGALARASMATYGAETRAIAAVIGTGDLALAAEVAKRVRDKLTTQPIEAMCIDFEDGYGVRSDADEDADAERAAVDLAATKRADESRPIIGLRIKALADGTRARATRTLLRFVPTLLHATGGKLPAGFTVTLPKVTARSEVDVLVEALEGLEATSGLARGSIGIELMVETPRALWDAEGRLALPALVAATKGRCVAAHLGAYDLTAALGVAATEQTLDHPLCDTARTVMSIALADTGVAVVDGATTLLPIPPHRESAERPLLPGERADNERAVADAWKLHASNVTRALRCGIYEGWDLHPAQLPARYAAVYAFFLRARDAMATRLARFVDNATRATRVGQVFDDAATGRGLLVFFQRGLACGALVDDDVATSGLTPEEVRTRTFDEIVAARAARTTDVSVGGGRS